MPRTLEQILPEVEKPARYLGGEHNSVVKDPKGVRVRACLAFPDVYEIGMSHLGLRILYSVLNRRDDMALERCFTPWPDMEKALRKHALPLTSLESRTPLGAFDVVGFSLQYELCFTNVLLMLDLAGIPFRTRDRGEGAPMILGGGPVAFSPEPVADFFDAFLIGDGEEAFPKLLEAYADMKEAGRSRGEMLKAFARLPGVYVPSLYATAEDPHCGLDYVTGPDPAALAAGEAPPPFPVRRAVLDDLNKYPFPSDTIVPHAEIVHDRVSIEIARGCTEGCRFCQAGIIYRPVRERTAESILESALDSLEETGYDEVSLTSLSPADYSCLPDLVEKVMDRMVDSRVGVSVSSLRPYGLTEQLAKQISRVKKSGFTIAPEAGTQRMRDVLNKGITEEHILQAAHNAFGEGWDLIKTYFMIGLPTETDEDLLAMIEIAEKIFRIGRDRLSKAKGGPGVTPRLHFSASSHVPKPHAPFQWAAMEPIEALYAKQRYISTRVRNRNIKFKKHHVETSHLEAVMSRGDRRLSKVIEIAYAKGCRFDGWTEHFRWNEWCAAFEEAGVPMQKYLDAIPLEATLPWDHIDTTVLKEFLVREWKRALKSMVSPACEKPFKKFNRPFRPDDKLVCYDCGCACDLPHITEERVTNRDNLLHISSRPGLRKPLAPAAND
ncbi:MAG TPA: TIGR03960 family B12-binding radical SAM protein, partial [Verrucomicrobiae bacterium]|nr:TIGR03960 family B12-binding radical SAM protein [Verrucomicrobiae bacterium]